MKIKADFWTIALIFILFAVVGMFIFSLIDFFTPRTAQVQQSSTQMKGMSRMSLTAFDKELAMEFMDKNHDGRCDVCGMPIEQCIDGGQLQCSMDSNAKIGILGSQHIHADWKIYINGNQLDLSDKYYGRIRDGKSASSFIHAEASAGEKTGDVLHMHATGVPLWILFKSIGMDFNKDCIALDDKEKSCNDGNKKLKFYVNGKENNKFENYVFNDLDKILISYGNEKGEEVKNQLTSITDFAKIHSK